MRLGLLFWVTVTAARADVSAIDARAELMRLPLTERCALHRLLARTFIDVRDLMRLARQPHDLSSFNMMILLDDRDAPTHGLLLRHAEQCAPLDLLGSWWSGPIDVRFAGEDPPPGDYEWLRLEAGDGRHFRFVRELNRFAISGFSPSNGSTPGVSAGYAVVRAALPVLVIEVQRAAGEWVEKRVELVWPTRSESF
jgi:hypothetical protein